MEFDKQEELERRKAKIARDVMEDFERRREERRSLENGWLLNMNFLSGNQFCDISPVGGIVEEDKRFFWQSRRVFNHIAPTLDARLAKLEKLRPTLRVRAFSDEDGDLKAAKLATGIIKYVQDRIAFNESVSKVTTWAETCGSAFYKVTWDETGGREVATSENGEPVFEGEVAISVVSPFEIYPDNLNAESMEEVASLIHAKVTTTAEIYERFGVEVPASEIWDNTVRAYAEPSAWKPPTGNQHSTNVEDGVILIERYTKPCKDAPQGKVEIVAGGKLLYEGVLPYVNGERGARVFPFIKQDCIRLAGAFFGVSIIDRLIPVQRAYNAVRNRKHEFLNRLSMGVLTVEDGSVDTEELAEEGLLPGKVLVYRQGGKAPEMLDCGKVPPEFAQEEEWLEQEFSFIGGVSDLSQNSSPVRVTSATGLQLLLSQDEARMSVTLNSIENALREVGKHILRLYRQFAGTARLMTLTGENKKTQVYYFNASDLSVNDLQFEAQDAGSPEERRETLMRLYQAGLLSDEQGNLTVENKNRILEAFGFGGYENARDISALHIARAGEENLEMKGKEVAVECYDDHDIHIVEHTRFLLSAEFKRMPKNEELKARYVAHLEEHKKRRV